jgi:hypothetical protein
VPSETPPMKSSTLPKVRNGHLSAEVGDALVLLTASGERAHQLNHTAAMVYRLCETGSLRSEAVESLGAELDCSLQDAEDLLDLTLTELAEKKLLVIDWNTRDVLRPTSTSRRDFLKAAALLPIVATVVRPAAAAVSSTACSCLINNGGSSSLVLECPTGVGDPGTQVVIGTRTDLIGCPSIQGASCADCGNAAGELIVAALVNLNPGGGQCSTACYCAIHSHAVPTGTTVQLDCEDTTAWNGGCAYAVMNCGALYDCCDCGGVNLRSLGLSPCPNANLASCHNTPAGLPLPSGVTNGNCLAGGTASATCP